MTQTTRGAPCAPVYSIDPAREPLLSAEEIAALLATWGLRRHASQIRRWFAVGARGIPLPSVCVGACRFSTEGALRWWTAALTASAMAAVAPAPAPAVPAGDGLSPDDRAVLRRAGMLPEGG